MTDRQEAMKPIKIADPEIGPWAVVSIDGKLLTWGLPTNADAWRWIDRRLGEFISRQEQVSDFIFSQTRGPGE